MIPCTLPTHTQKKNKVSPISSYTCLLSLCMHRAYGGWWLVSGGLGYQGGRGEPQPYDLCVWGVGGCPEMKTDCGGQLFLDDCLNWLRAVTLTAPLGDPQLRDTTEEGERGFLFTAPIWERRCERICLRSTMLALIKKKQKNKTDCLVALQSITLTPN